MKTLEELKAIRDKAKKQIDIRNNNENSVRILVGMATCGITAGARPVLNSFLEEIEKRGLKNVVVTQTGCIGMCEYEPIVEVIMPNKEKITYIKMDPQKVVRVVNDHIVNNNIVTEYTLGTSL